MTTSRILGMAGLAAALSILFAAGVATRRIEAGGGEVWRAPFRLICHGQTERAFEIDGTPMPICARCTGVYGGIALGSLFVLIAPPGRRSRGLLLAGVALSLPLVIDGSLQTLGVWSTENVPRGATGLAFGVGLIALAANGIVSTRESTPRGKAAGLSHP